MAYSTTSKLERVAEHKKIDANQVLTDAQRAAAHDEIDRIYDARDEEIIQGKL